MCSKLTEKYENQVLVEWCKNNDEKLNFIPNEMIEIHADMDDYPVGTGITTKPGPQKRYRGIVLKSFCSKSHTSSSTPIARKLVFSKSPFVSPSGIKKTILPIKKKSAITIVNCEKQSELPKMLSICRGKDDRQTPWKMNAASMNMDNKQSSELMLLETAVASAINESDQFLHHIEPIIGSSVLKEAATQKNAGNSTVSSVAADQSQLNFGLTEQYAITPIKNFRQFESENRSKESHYSILKNISQNLQSLDQKFSTLISQNDHIISLLSSRRVEPTQSGEQILFHLKPLEPLESVLNDQKWNRQKFMDNGQLFVSELACDLACRVFFGDDILKKSNVLQCNKNKLRPNLDPVKLMKIKSIVKNIGSDRFSSLEFEEKWAKAIERLQGKCKNLRSGALRMATSSELSRMITM